MAAVHVAPKASEITAIKEPWGFTLWQNGRQVGCGNGVSIASYLGRDLTDTEECDFINEKGLILKNHKL